MEKKEERGSKGERKGKGEGEAKEKEKEERGFLKQKKTKEGKERKGWF